MPNLVGQTPKAGDQYRFVVGSANEAVRILHERFGENARVISVRQVEGSGLARFLRAPKLEVIAEVIGEKEPDKSVEIEEPTEKIEVDLLESVEPEATAAIETENAVDPPAQAPGDELARLLARGG